MTPRKLRIGWPVVVAALAGPPPALAAADLPIGKGVTYCFDAIEIDSDGVFGPDHQCFAVAPATDAGSVLLVCENAEIEYGLPWSEAVTVVENAEAQTLTYIDKDGRYEAVRCDLSPYRSSVPGVVIVGPSFLAERGLTPAPPILPAQGRQEDELSPSVGRPQ